MSPVSKNQKFFSGGGELGALIREFNWSNTPLGDPSIWPRSLLTSVSIMLTSRQPIWIGWGKDLTYLYNDPYKSIIGGKHPYALGQPTSVVWKEIWDDIAPLLATAMKGTEGTYVESQLLIMERNGYPEETYYTFSYSPIPDDNGIPSGIFCANTDDTSRVIGERQLSLLHELAAYCINARDFQDACARSAEALSGNLHDIPFALIYLAEVGGGTLKLCGVSGIQHDHPAAAQLLTLGDFFWPFVNLCNQQNKFVVVDLKGKFDVDLPTGPWSVSPTEAVIMPFSISGEHGQAGYLIAGLNPFRKFDHNYQNFLNRVTGQIASNISTVLAHEEERKRGEALAALDRAKTAFFSNVSHEFRTPLTLMLGPIEDALNDPQASPANLERLTLIRRNGMRLQKLVNTLLDFSRIESGKAQVLYEPTNLTVLTSDLASNFKSAMDRAGLRFIINISSFTQSAYVDRDMWEKIVLNLLSNAFKYTQKGEIEITLKQEDNRALLSVRDSGLGISESEMPNIFERFHRTESAQARTHEGTGIGLALVQELVKLHSGEVTVESQLGKGSVFCVSIPLGKDHLPAEHVRHSLSADTSEKHSEAFIDEVLSWLPDEKTPKQDNDPRADIAVYDALTANARIVVADDNSDMRGYLERLLKLHYRVEAVPDGEAALAAIEREIPDLVLTDIMMPRLSGFDLLKALRQNIRLQKVPVIMLSARAGEEASIEGLEAGADDYLIKPFNARELLARVSGTIRLARMRADSEKQLISVLEVGKIFIWDWDLRTGKVTRSTPAKDILGIDDGDVESFVARLHPEDSERVQNALRGSIEGKNPHDIEFRYMSNTGIRWLVSRGEVIKGVDGKPERFVGIAMDITDRKNAEQALRYHNIQFETLLNAAPLGVFMVDDKFKIREVNPVAVPAFGEIGGGVVGRDFAEITHILWEKSYAEEVIKIFQNTLETGQPFYTPERSEFRHDRGTTEYYEWRVVRITLPDGNFGLVCYFRDISQQVEARQAIADARDKAELANHAKSDFLANMSHEIRTPMNAVVGLANLLEVSGNNPARQKEFIQTLKISAQQLMELINDLLDIARLESKQVQLETIGFKLHEILEEVISINALKAEEKGIKLSIKSNAVGNIDLLGDPLRLRQVLLNVVGNAVKFTSKGSVVLDISCVDQDTESLLICITVTDTGIGIPSSKLDTIFSKFSQADTSVTRKYGGTGLGLSITKSLTELMGGEITAQSELEKGSIFTIKIPFHRPTFTVSVGKSAANEWSDISDRERQLNSKYRILLVEDYEANILVATTMLSRFGYDVSIAVNGLEALQKVNAERFDLILMDVQMPVMDGYKATESIRQQEQQNRSKEIPIIGMTAHALLGDRERCFIAGMNDYIAKPFDPTVLSTLLTKYLKTVEKNFSAIKIAK